MLDKNLISSLAELPAPVVTVYVNIQSSNPSVHGLRPTQAVWLNQQAKVIVESLPTHEQEGFRQQVKRIFDFLGKRGPKGKALLIIASPSVWQVVPLPMDVENELSWGRPALSQLEILLDKNRPHCVVVADRKSARIFKYWAGDMYQLSRRPLTVDISQWKKKDLGHLTGQPIAKTRGAQREVFNNRMEAQYKRLYRSIAKEAQQLCEAGNLDMIFLVGSARITEQMQAVFAKRLGKRVVLINEDLGGFSLSELKAYLKDTIAESQEKQQLTLVTNLVTDPRHCVLGLDETLTQLQKGKIRTLMFSDHLKGSLQECIECGWIDGSADPVCSRCGRERRAAELPEVLFDSARDTNTDVSVVTGGAASKLDQSGGIGGWLRGKTQAELR